MFDVNFAQPSKRCFGRGQDGSQNLKPAEFLQLKTRLDLILVIFGKGEAFFFFLFLQCIFVIIISFYCFIMKMSQFLSISTIHDSAQCFCTLPNTKSITCQKCVLSSFMCHFILSWLHAMKQWYHCTQHSILKGFFFTLLQVGYWIWQRCWSQGMPQIIASTTVH